MFAQEGKPIPSQRRVCEDVRYDLLSHEVVKGHM
jgi:hypothetical protein